MKKNKSGLPIWSKMLIVLCCLAVVFTMVFFLREWYPVAKFREFLVESVNTILYNSKSVRYDSPGDIIVESEDFTRIEEDVPFHVPRPGWLPEGYEISYADYVIHNTGDYNIKVQYINTDREIINYSLMTNLTIDPSGYTVPYEVIDIDELEVYIVYVEPESCYADYINSQGFYITIGNCDIESLRKIIENIG